MLRAAAGSPKLRTTETLESLLRLFDVSRLHGLDGTTLLLMLAYEREHKDRKSLKKQLFHVRQIC